MSQKANTIATFILLGIFSAFLVHQSFPHHHDDTNTIHHHESSTHSHDHDHHEPPVNEGNTFGSHNHAIDFAQFTLKKSKNYKFDGERYLSALCLVINDLPPIIKKRFQLIPDNYHSPPESAGNFTFHQLRAPPYLG